MRILIIEDDKDLAQLTKLALEKENFTVDMCLDGAEGLYYMRENMYAVSYTHLDVYKRQ